MKSKLLLASAVATMLAANSKAENFFESWIQRYDPDLGQSPIVSDVATDVNGNVAVTGFTYSGGTRIYYTAKYDALDGHVVWESVYNSGFGASEAKAVAFDASGNVVVTGKSVGNGSSSDYYTIKYRGSDGFELWHDRYNGTNNGEDEADFIAVDSAGNVVVTGSSVGAGSAGDMHTRKLNSNGQFVGEIRFTTAATRDDFATGLVIDSAGNVIVCGVAQVASGDKQFYVAKYELDATPTITWSKTFGVDGDDDIPTGITLDSTDAVIVTGTTSNQNSSNAFLTRKYSAAGVFDWDAIEQPPISDFFAKPAGVACDAQGNAFVTGTVTIDNFNTVIVTTRYNFDTGAREWINSTPAPGEPGVSGSADEATAIAVDATGTVIVSGSQRITGEDSHYYVVRYSNGGALLSEKTFEGGFENGGDDKVKSMAVDPFGNVVITGDSLREAGTLTEFVTIKYGHTVLATGDPVTGGNVPDNAKISAVFSPVVSDSGKVAARVILAAGKKKLGAILSVGGGAGLVVEALEGDDAPGGGKFKSFSDPVLSQNGRIAFTAKLTGVPGSQSTGVYSNFVSGTLQQVLQQGKQVTGMAQGIVLQSVSSISLRNTQLVGLIKVAGKSAGVTGANSTVLYGFTSLSGTELLRTGEDITLAEGDPTTIKSLTVFTPPKGSAGQGRNHSVFRVLARATLADKRTVLLADTAADSITQLLYTGQTASAISGDATWKSFGLPAIDAAGTRYVTLAGLTPGDGDVTKNDDTALIYSADAMNFTSFAREGGTAPGAGDATYASFQDPLVNSNGDVSFVGTLKGKGVKGNNKTGIWFGTPGVDVNLYARTGDSAPGPDGADTTANFTSFTSLALPSGVNAAPLFLAKIGGKGVSGKTNFGLWCVDANGLVRQLIRNGDQYGDSTLKKFSVLQPTSGSVGVTRQFSNTRSVVFLGSFSDKSTGVVQVGIP